MKTTLILGLALLAVGCRVGASAHSRQTASGGVFRIGYQKGGALHLLRLSGALDRRLARKGVRVEWLPFVSAPPMLEAIGVGSLDMGAGGDAPCVFAQAAGHPIALLANTPPGDQDSRAVIVPRNSSLSSLGELVGKRVAISKGTGTHNFLIQALDQAGVPYDRIKPIYLSPPDARAAFDAGKVDAWAAWDPYLAAAREATGAHVLVNGHGIVSPGGFYFSLREFARKRPDWIRAALEEVDHAGVWLGRHPHEAALLLAPHLGVSVAALETMNRHVQKGARHVGFRPVDREIIAAQQQVADNFYRIGLLPRRIDVRETLLSAPEYAAILPATARQEARR